MGKVVSITGADQLLEFPLPTYKKNLPEGIPFIPDAFP
jgi:hypothetical protein